MPYVILIAGLLLGLYGLIRFSEKATTAQMKRLLEASLVFVFILGFLYLIITEKLGLVVVMLIAALPVLFARWRKRRIKQLPPPASGPDSP
ncbi:MAG TPA: hypothetical protein VIF12_08135 [Micavibrio sp.]|jgi:Ca2+/Na+ antiporter